MGALTNLFAAAVSFLQAGVGAIARSVQSKLRETISITDFGAKCDGIVDDTAAINLAITAATGKNLLIVGTPLITSTLNFPNPIKLIFDGPMRATDAFPQSYFLKAAAMATPGVVITTVGFWAEGGGVVSQAGATGGGIVINGQTANWIRPFVGSDGGNGIRVGRDAAGLNCNGFYLESPFVASCGGKGIYIHDGGTNANAGIILKPLIVSCTGIGIHLNANSGNIIINPNVESCVGGGILFDDASEHSAVYGGDVEANTGFDIKLTALSNHSVILNPGVSIPIIDLSVDGYVLQLDNSTTFIGTCTGATVALTGTVNIVKYGRQVTLDMPDFTGTSNAVSKTITGMPAAFFPTTQKRGTCICVDNGGARTISFFTLSNAGVFTFYPTPAGGAWTNVGTFDIDQFSFTYTTG